MPLYLTCTFLVAVTVVMEFSIANSVETGVDRTPLLAEREKKRKSLVSTACINPDQGLIVIGEEGVHCVYLAK